MTDHGVRPFDCVVNETEVEVMATDPEPPAPEMVTVQVPAAT